MSEDRNKYVVGESGGRGKDICVWDCETGSLGEEFNRKMMKPRPPMPVFTDGKTKGSRTALDKQAEWIAEQEQKEADWLAEAALHAERARVLCIGVLMPGGEVKFFQNDNETELLAWWWSFYLSVPEYQRFVGFNTTNFDVPFVLRRSYICGVKPPPTILMGRGYVNERFIDLFTLWQCGDRRETISLDRMSKAFGGSGKTGSGADFARLWASDRAAALEYCENDLRLCLAIAERIL